MRDITQIVYTSGAGPILPELQWYERITITASSISLARNGRISATHVNVGTWTWPADTAAVQALFARLAALDPAAIVREEPDEPPDGGGTESYCIAYGQGKEWTLAYDPGVDYSGGDLVVGPIWAFIRALRMPAEAASRYRDTKP